MKLYYAKVTVLNEGGEFVGIYTTYQKCHDALVATGYYGDKTYILEVEPDNEKPLRAWEMTLKKEKLPGIGAEGHGIYYRLPFFEHKVFSIRVDGWSPWHINGMWMIIRCVRWVLLIAQRVVRLCKKMRSLWKGAK